MEATIRCNSLECNMPGLMLPVKGGEEMANCTNGTVTSPRQSITPLSCLLPGTDDKLALILLNLDGHKTPGLKTVLGTLWDKAVLRACADGGANSLYDTMATSNEEDKHIPHFISGDFDSARQEVLDFYKKKGAEIHKTPDQDATDFTKCLQLVLERITSHHLQVDSIVVVGANSMSRFDHILANVDTLYQAKDLTDKPVFLIAGMSMVYLLSPGAEIHKTPDQDATDFTKCLQLVLERITSHHLQVDSIVVVGANSMSRFDHILANVDTLYQAKDLTDKPVFLIAGMSMVYLLSPGQHTIRVSTGIEGKWCGLLPIGHPCKDVTTTGLKWDLNHDTLEFGTLVSTSNEFVDQVVTVETDKPLVWTMGFKLH
ncbi:thiamin pyrophosphokinase 1-like [Lingula anatina]|uniref:Thiamin pyrophosphokinase 1-like n=1 Tax=Lingula anatina TaxID=7574 RepID=A0A2R2ML09_LINAN|nr:thiamin pyrophosphokinase 1-like [Lingula anatina]|eukprot:XP_023930885.1 thiamin pyrophosphokinase 1-like [Lingula anatina]